MYFTAFTLSTNNSSTSLLSNFDSDADFLSNNNTESTNSLLSILNDDENAGFDAFGGKDIFGTIDLSNMNESFFACATQTETVGSVACDSAETIGSVAFNSAETAGSVACVDAGAGAACGSSEGSGSFSSFC